MKHRRWANVTLKCSDEFPRALCISFFESFFFYLHFNSFLHRQAADFDVCVFLRLVPLFLRYLVLLCVHSICVALVQGDFNDVCVRKRRFKFSAIFIIKNIIVFEVFLKYHVCVSVCRRLFASSGRVKCVHFVTCIKFNVCREYDAWLTSGKVALNWILMWFATFFLFSLSLREFFFAYLLIGFRTLIAVIWLCKRMRHMQREMRK